VLECESVEAVKGAVKAGIGMGFQYRDTIESELQSGQLSVVPISVLNDLRVNWFILRRNNKSLSMNAKDFLALLHNNFHHPKNERIIRHHMTGARSL
jgi:DNA-binding transcriptional LysR family regulator